MSRYYDYGGWAPYVTVAQRRAKAEREMAALRRKGQAIAPVIIDKRAITTTFWGKAWSANLESYRDFAYRLERGRSYVRNRAVLDLQIAPRAVTALVSGTSVYRVEVAIDAVPKAQWQSICRDCAGGIDSLVDLLRGRLSEGVMERICRQETGLFPRPSEIRFSCSCPDFAGLCKHVAAALYGIGARLDEKPDLLFRLRAVDEGDLLGQLGADTLLSTTAPDAERILEADDMSALFGIEMAGDDAPTDDAPTDDAPTPAKPARKRPAASKPALELTPDGFVKWWE